MIRDLVHPKLLVDT
jgi:hypothetical protein